MTFTLALTGDSMITRGGLVSADPDAQRLRRLIAGADVSFTNLEVVASDLADPAYAGGQAARDSAAFHSSGAFTPTLIAPAAVLDELLAVGIDIVAFANNHTLNLGVDGMLDTVRELRRRGLPCAGVGTTLESASMPAYADTAAGSVAVVGCSATFTPGDEATRPSASMRGRPGLSPLRHRTRLGVTEGQLAVIAGAHRQLGLDDELDYLRDMRFLGPDAPGERTLFGSTFFTADPPRVQTDCVPSDVDRICRWVREAKARAELAVVSVHSHENGPTLTEPAGFLVELAHAVIDAGADVVAGHGPHRVRGIELYRGRPIFYSLGNFVGQFELLTMLSSHSYDALGAADDRMPYEVVGGDCLGFADDEEYWRSVVPVLSYDGDRLARIDLHPITLGAGRPAPQRGRPALAGPDQGAAVIEDLRRLSVPFGTKIGTEGELAVVDLPGT
jgi:poly-gamma-glutamate capsule biosynthesis protein CapA/YwtB (metallophosphatase superfamily)